MKNKNFIKNFFEGNFTLWKSYWLVGELFNAIFILLIFNLEVYVFNNNFIHLYSINYTYNFL